jgi:hypothetical protein
VKNYLNINAQNNFYYLFASLVLLLFATTLSAYFHSDLAHNILNVFILLVLFVDIKSLTHQTSWRKIAYILIIVMFLLIVAKQHINPVISDYIRHSIFLLFFLKSFILSLKHIFASTKITGHVLIGAVSAYLQLAIIWSFFYLLLLAFNPDSFNGIHYEHWSTSFFETTYFSFVTLTTLGYGDVVPSTPLAKFFVYTEAIAGTFYMAVIVATIVSAKLSYKHRNDR